MSKGLEITRKAVGIIADALDKASPPGDPEARGVVKILRAHEAGDNSADIFEAARQFNKLDAPLRQQVASESEKKAKERHGKKAKAADPAPAPAPAAAPVLTAQKPGKDNKSGSSLYGVLNRR